MKKTLGVIGGMGPLATVKLFEKIVLMTDAKSDQEHIHIIIDNNTLIPDRSAYILDGGEDPKIELLNSARKLEDMGADFLIMPCNTAHIYYDYISNNVGIPFLSMIDETAKFILNNHSEIKNIGLLATEGTYTSKVYDEVFSKYDLEIIIPNGKYSRNIMELIYNIKMGIRQDNLDGFYETLEYMRTLDVGAFILGCTELSVALELYSLKGSYIDAMDVIARRAIEYSGVTVKNI